MTKQIALSKGKFATVDDEDYELVMRCSWHFQKTKYDGYAAGRPFGKHGGIYRMHRFLMGSPEGMEVDHIDMNGLNNTRNNLRLATHQQNRSHNHKYSTNKSGYLGVSLWKNSTTPKWRAAITVNRKQIHLGLFPDPESAARAYDESAIKHHGNFASLNFPPKE